jgi:predicted Zn-dependent protease with MMP-like domain
MSKYKTIYTEVEVEVDISDFDTEDLIEELEDRDELPSRGLFNGNELVEQIWMLRRNGKDYQRQLDDLIYNVTGRIV